MAFVACDSPSRIPRPRVLFKSLPSNPPKLTCSEITWGSGHEDEGDEAFVEAAVTNDRSEANQAKEKEEEQQEAETKVVSKEDAEASCNLNLPRPPRPPSAQKGRKKAKEIGGGQLRTSSSISSANHSLSTASTPTAGTSASPSRFAASRLFSSIPPHRGSLRTEPSGEPRNARLLDEIQRLREEVAGRCGSVAALQARILQMSFQLKEEMQRRLEVEENYRNCRLRLQRLEAQNVAVGRNLAASRVACEKYKSMTKALSSCLRPQAIRRRSSMASNFNDPLAPSNGIQGKKNAASRHRHVRSSSLASSFVSSVSSSRSSSNATRRFADNEKEAAGFKRKKKSKREGEDEECRTKKMKKKKRSTTPARRCTGRNNTTPKNYRVATSKQTRRHAEEDEESEDTNTENNEDEEEEAEDEPTISTPPWAQWDPTRHRWDNGQTNNESNNTTPPIRWEAINDSRVVPISASLKPAPAVRISLPITHGLLGTTTFPSQSSSMGRARRTASPAAPPGHCINNRVPSASSTPAQVLQPVVFPPPPTGNAATSGIGLTSGDLAAFYASHVHPPYLSQQQTRQQPIRFPFHLKS